MNISTAIKFLPGIIGKLFGNKEEKQRQSFSKRAALLDQYSSEFRQLNNRTWLDSVVDGLNRLPRPIMAFGVLWLFWYAVDDPAGFTVTMQALDKIPSELWLALGGITAFYFGDELIAQNRKTKVIVEKKRPQRRRRPSR